MKNYGIFSYSARSGVRYYYLPVVVDEDEEDRDSPRLLELRPDGKIVLCRGTVPESREEAEEGGYIKLGTVGELIEAFEKVAKAIEEKT
jgi:hypothetical protein